MTRLKYDGKRKKNHVQVQFMMNLRIVKLQFPFEKINFYVIITIISISRYPSYAYIMCVIGHGCSHFNF